MAAALSRGLIKPGSIIYCFSSEANKSKFSLVVYLDNNAGFLLCTYINSRIHPLIEKNPTLRTCQVDIDPAMYNFLDHTSYIDCTKINDEFDLEQVASSGGYRGNLSDTDLLRVIEAINSAPTISPVDKDLIISALGG